MNDSTHLASPQADTPWVGLARDLIAFDNLPEHFPESLNLRRIAEHQMRILNHVGEACERVEALSAYQAWRARLLAAGEALRTLLAKPLDGQALLALKPQLVAQRQVALLAQAQLQLCEGVLDAVDLQRLQYALGLADEPDDDVLHLDVGVGDPDEPTVLSGAMIVTTEQALKTPSLGEPALLYVPGEEGGLQKFASLQVLKDQLVFTLATGNETTLWQHVSAAERESAMAAPIRLVNRVITVQPILHGVNSQLKTVGSLYRQSTFCRSERVRELDIPCAGDRADEMASSRTSSLLPLSSRELMHNLGVALDPTRERAIALIAEQQRTAELVPQLPAWLLNCRISRPLRRSA